MKKLLTIVVCDRTIDDRIVSSFDEVELIYTNNNEADIPEAIKHAKGKYTFILSHIFTIEDIKQLVSVLDESDEDIICFEFGSVAKTQLFKGLNFKEDNCTFLFKIYAAMSAKSIKKTLYKPFIFNGNPLEFDDHFKDKVLLASAEFKRVKAKLEKDVYNYVFDMLVKKVVEYYMRAMLAIRSHKYPPEELVKFDNLLKGEIVLYIAVEKRFTPAHMQRLRDKSFKINFLQARKINKALTTKGAP